MDAQPLTIALLDSGVGCLSFFSALQTRLPQARFLFGMDNANLPYGPKSDDQVIACVHSLARQTVETYQPDVLVVACNTASTIVLPSLRARFSIPVVGVVPAIKPAAQISRTRVIGLLATPGTVRRQYTDALIREFASDCTVNMVGTSELVAMAERKLRGTPVDLDALKHEIQPLFERAPNATGKIDTVVLGCTHFPMLVDELVQCSPWPISWIDSSEAVANRVLTIAAQLPERPTPATSPQHIALFTSSQGMDELRPWLTNLGVVPATFS